LISKALIYKNEAMIELIENYWPTLKWQNQLPSTIRQTMDTTLLIKIMNSGHDYVPLMSSFDDAYCALDKPITDTHQVTQNYWKGVGYILGSHFKQFEHFWKNLKQLPMAEENYYAAFVKASCLAKNQKIVNHLLENPPKGNMDNSLKMGIATQLLPVPETIAWLNFPYLAEVYCSLAEPNVSYKTRENLISFYSIYLKRAKGKEFWMSRGCFSNLQEMKVLNVIYDIRKEYDLVRIAINNQMHQQMSSSNFNIKYLVDGKFYRQIASKLKKFDALYQYIITKEDFDFVVGAAEAQVLNIVEIIALAFLRKKEKYALKLMKALNISKQAIQSFAEERGWTNVKDNFSLNLWSSFQS
jgi:hypothetical protein